MPDTIQGRMRLLDYLNLVSRFDGKTIKMNISVEPSTPAIRNAPIFYHAIIDTGADTTAFTKEFLTRRGYGKYSKSGIIKNTTTGETELLTCEINGLTIADQFTFGKIKIDVLENWKAHTVVGVVGMDILSRLTLILSHEHKKLRVLTSRYIL